MISYDPRGHTWDSWCALMSELFASNQLGTTTEDHWQDWAKGMNGIGFFADKGIPDPRGFAAWQDWASVLCGIVEQAAQ